MQLAKFSAPIALVAFLVGCSASEPENVAALAPNETEIRAALQFESEKFGLAMQSKDHIRVATLFTEDATWIFYDASTHKGRAAIEVGAKALIESTLGDVMGPSIIEKLIVINDSEALTFSHVDITTTKAGKTEIWKNPYATYWKKGTDGIWRIAYDVSAYGPIKTASIQ